MGGDGAGFWYLEGLSMTMDVQLGSTPAQAAIVMNIHFLVFEENNSIGDMPKLSPPPPESIKIDLIECWYVCPDNLPRADDDILNQATGRETATN